jgi:hypothetical protein
MGALSTILYPLHPKRTRITRSSWPTRSTCFMAALMRPPAPPNTSALSQTRPPLPYPLQSVVAFCLWHEAYLYDDWSAAGLATSDNTELQAIVDGVCQAYNVGLKDVHQVHVFSNSTNTLHLTMDMSHHSGQHSSCPFAKCWCLGSNATQITVSISTTSQLVWSWRTTTLHTSLPHWLKAGSAPVISANFARQGVVTRMLEGWNSLFQSKKYIGLNFLTLYQRKDTPFVPTHVKSGLWMCKVRHSHSLTICLVHCTTGHAPIGVYHSRFFPKESTACRCGFPMETVSHVLY